MSPYLNSPSSRSRSRTCRRPPFGRIRRKSSRPTVGRTILAKERSGRSPAAKGQKDEVRSACVSLTFAKVSESLRCRRLLGAPCFRPQDPIVNYRRRSRSSRASVLWRGYGKQKERGGRRRGVGTEMPTQILPMSLKPAIYFADARSGVGSREPVKISATQTAEIRPPWRGVGGFCRTSRSSSRRDNIDRSGAGVQERLKERQGSWGRAEIEQNVHSMLSAEYTAVPLPHFPSIEVPCLIRRCGIIWTRYSGSV